MENVGFGIDVGGSGIKGARVDLATGEFIGERIKILTPQPATPDAVAETIAEIIRQAQWDGPVGITLPSVIKNGVARSAANIDPSWVNTDTTELFARHLGEREISVLNDADAAGLAEVNFGDEHARHGAVILLTLGTGIGSAVLIDGALFPNTELGHLEVDGKEAEHRASSAVKDREELSYKQWTKRLTKVLKVYEALFNPTIFIIGGGISRKFDKWGPMLDINTPIVPASLRNRAGIVGAALAVRDQLHP
ncbi:polyphosphate glucokinase [Corynebacterium kutscheri]|uniref:Polyphosphate glucokinase n=1 Tax=Corynebacterium kutscheri TaxID=35755 RepID=A0A0F6QZW6_9CORY|nr:ROK family protein [Corynebacterium kutscheri]AKE41372.1 transcriptional regulator/sugar kinase [Corynebacterium kutscheri]VEH08649.1 polyphosphate glucokinase [Corynebacterium kutscheri]VEH09696.1 polyphosphate glucokinase [Corynebacterium kutscheri]VEH79778.1 polyphosphate glucokinase [Corynebacterium kutscheri]